LSFLQAKTLFSNTISDVKNRVFLAQLSSRLSAPGSAQLRLSP
jgi:hypothetical protein